MRVVSRLDIKPELRKSLDHEHVETPASHSFRLLWWDQSLSEIYECLGDGKRQRISGQGDHWHAHQAIELTYIESGHGTRFIGDSIGAIETPELVLLGANLPHYWQGLNESSGAAIQFDIKAAGSSQGGLVGLAELSTLGPLWDKAECGLAFPAEVARDLGLRIRSMAEQSPLEALCELLSILSSLSRLHECDSRPLSSKRFALSSGVRYAREISQAINLIIDHHVEELSLDDIAEAIGLSRVTLCRYFRRYTGRSVIAFLNGVRIDQARRQLIASAAPVGQIALDVGYGNLSHFNRQFSRATGETPTAFRNRHLA